MGANSPMIYPPSPAPPIIEDRTLPAASIATDPNSFFWNEQRLRAVSLLADGRYRDKQVAQMVGIPVYVLRKWKLNPIFENQLYNAIEKYKSSILNTTIAQKHYRIKSLQERHQLLYQILLQRQEQVDPASNFYNEMFVDVPGLNTGLILPSISSTKVGLNEYIVTKEAKIDASLLSEFRAIEKQAAEETGQWSETHNINILQKAYIGIDIAQV